MRKEKVFLKIIKNNSLINVGSGQEFQIKKFAEIINKLTFSNKKLKFNKKFPDGTKRKILDISILKKIGWKSKINLYDGLRNTINWYIDNMNWCSQIMENSNYQASRLGLKNFN